MKNSYLIIVCIFLICAPTQAEIVQRNCEITAVSVEKDLCNEQVQSTQCIPCGEDDRSCADVEAELQNVTIPTSYTCCSDCDTRCCSYNYHLGYLKDPGHRYTKAKPGSGPGGGLNPRFCTKHSPNMRLEYSIYPCYDLVVSGGIHGGKISGDDAASGSFNQQRIDCEKTMEVGCGEETTKFLCPEGSDQIFRPGNWLTCWEDTENPGAISFNCKHQPDLDHPGVVHSQCLEDAKDGSFVTPRPDPAANLGRSWAHEASVPLESITGWTAIGLGTGSFALSLVTSISAYTKGLRDISLVLPIAVPVATETTAETLQKVAELRPPLPVPVEPVVGVPVRANAESFAWLKGWRTAYYAGYGFAALTGAASVATGVAGVASDSPVTPGLAVRTDNRFAPTLVDVEITPPDGDFYSGPSNPTWSIAIDRIEPGGARTPIEPPREAAGFAPTQWTISVPGLYEAKLHTSDPAFVPPRPLEFRIEDSTMSVDFRSNVAATCPRDSTRYAFTPLFEVPNARQGITTFTMDFGDGTVNVNQMPLVHKYEKAGKYNVTLTAITSDGQRLTKSHTIWISYAFSGLSLVSRVHSHGNTKPYSACYYIDGIDNLGSDIVSIEWDAPFPVGVAPGRAKKQICGVIDEAGEFAVNAIVQDSAKYQHTISLVVKVAN